MSRSKVKVSRDKKPGFSVDISGTAERICDKFTRMTYFDEFGKDVWTCLKVRVNFGGLRTFMFEKHLCTSFLFVEFYSIGQVFGVASTSGLEGPWRWEIPVQ